ncbi:MAG: 4Fe-4S dicluster domain-containing protein [Candidatus Latescibacterota bacterium]|nr:MAG: 4Fe-4S dicluster domain-containing protein [Candidatus Latescibacterota bacterium]
MVIDARTCVGCSGCVIACRTENNVAPGHSRDWIFTETAGSFPKLRMTIRSERCNHCKNAACVRACPTGASWYGPGGSVQVNADKCTGCKACIAGCPYDARFVDPRTGTVDKCTFCMHRIDRGMPTTACQDTCPTQSIHFGDLNDAASEVSKLLATREWYTLRPEAGTQPMVYYLK